jgi:hypothetical protein
LLFFLVAPKRRQLHDEGALGPSFQPFADSSIFRILLCIILGTKALKVWIGAVADVSLDFSSLCVNWLRDLRYRSWMTVSAPASTL